MSVKRSLQDQILYTNQAPFRILNAIKSGTRLNEQQLQAAGLRLHNAGHQTMLVQMNLLNSLERQTGMLDPALILKRGFSITLIQGKAIHDAQELETSAMIETILFKGRVISRIEDIYRENNNE
jgi:exodeoxyribonuclease VII large subunit